MSWHDFVLAVCVLTVLAHIGLLWTRGWVIGQLWKEFAKMKAEWTEFRKEEEERNRVFRQEYKSPWITEKRRAS